MGRSSKLTVYLASAVLLSGPACAASLGSAHGGAHGSGASGVHAAGAGAVAAGVAAGTHGYGARGVPTAPVARPGARELPGNVQRDTGAVREHLGGRNVGEAARWRRFGIRGRRFAYPFTITGYGGGDGPGFETPNGPALADAPYDLPDAEEPPYLPEPPRPCVRPLIIKIGRGARRTAKTRVVYGAPPACVRGY